MRFIRLFSKIPFPLLYLLSSFLYYLIYYVLRYRKKVVFNNLRNSFPEKDEKEITKTAKGFYKNLLDVILETIKMMTISEDELIKRVDIENLEVLQKFYHQKRSVIVLTAHQCNWEWLTGSSTLQISHAVDAVYLQLTNEFSERLMKDIRSRFGGNLVEKKDFVKSLIARKDILKVNALLADQSPGDGANALWTNFLHQESKFFTGAEKIAIKLDLPVLYIEMWRVKRGFYKAKFSVLTDDPGNTEKNEITLRYVNALEKTIRESPSDWLWSHKRWKYPRKKGELVSLKNTD